MSNKKKSFLLHIDSLDILDDLTNGQAGVLFKAIKAYQHNEEFPLDSVVKIAFSPFKNQFFRDDEKYTETCKRRAIAGSLGGKQKVANASNCKQDLANLADTKNKNKNKTNNKSDSKDTLKKSQISLVSEVVALFNKSFINIPDVTKITQTRKSKVIRIFKDHPNFKIIDNWKGFFEYIQNSDFLMGRVEGKEFLLTFDWLINPTNFLKTLEGNYDNK